MVELLKANKFDALAKAVPNRVSELLDCEPIQSLINNAGRERVTAYLEAEIIKLAANFNGNPALNVKDYQVPVIAEQLIDNYGWESLEDFTLCFRRASAGFYGEIYRIDGAVIGQWFSKYLDEKYDALEQRKAKEKHQEKETRENNAVDGSKYIAQMLENLGVPQKERGPKEETEYQRHKLENPYPVTPPEKVQEKLNRLRELQERAIRDKYPNATEEQIQQLIHKL